MKTPSVVRHIPERTCIGCRDTKGKRELMRLVRTTGDGIEVDPTGKRPGRGVYLCPRWECWQRGLKGGGLERRLRAKLTSAERQRIQEFASTLPRGG
ncbi:MAG: YlxR family protein [Dehalococcoidia bacterium]|nr:YlxR family protein [Dehalococcoidia bacterium]